MSTELKPEIMYSDREIVVINKPPGLLSVPGRGPDKQQCAAGYIRGAFSGCIEQPAVHRLDMDTSGLMVFALTAASHKNLSIQFQDRTVKKEYIALIEGVTAAPLGRIELKFRLDPEDRPRQVYDPVHGKTGITEYRCLSFEGDRTRVKFTPLTGRTHQLRVHAAHSLGLGCPIAGDRLYGAGNHPYGSQGSTGADRLMLHASELGFTHPLTAEHLYFAAEPDF